MLLLDQSDCGIEVQAANAQGAGVKLLAVIQEKQGSNEQFNFSLGSEEIKIPVIILSRSEGDKLKGYLEEKEEVEEPLMVFSMPLPSDDHVVLNFYLNVEDENFFGLVSQLKEYLSQFDSEVSFDFTIMRDSFNSVSYEDTAKLNELVNCLDKEIVFDVLKAFRNNCIEKGNNTPDCFKRQAESVNPSYLSSFNSCLSKSEKNHKQVIGLLKGLNSTSNSYLLVNQKRFIGGLKPKNIFNAICGAFLRSPDNCLYVDNNYTAKIDYKNFKEEKKSNKKFLIIINILVIGVLVMLAACMFLFIYGKIYQKVLAERVEMIVKDTIETYEADKQEI